MLGLVFQRIADFLVCCDCMHRDCTMWRFLLLANLHLIFTSCTPTSNVIHVALVIGSLLLPHTWALHRGVQDQRPSLDRCRGLIPSTRFARFRERHVVLQYPPQVYISKPLVETTVIIVPFLLGKEKRVWFFRTRSTTSLGPRRLAYSLAWRLN